MSAPRSSLRSFLSSAKSNLRNAIISQQRVTIVVGNESADLDSITSAILFAYLKSNSTTSPLTNQSVNKHTPPSQYPPFYIPLLNIPRADVKIRPELLALLPYANIEPSHLITLDDLTTSAPAGINPDHTEELQPQLTRLILTDHNKLEGSLAPRFRDSVVGCIDHHVDEGTVPPDTGNEPRIIKTAGSCTSLVLEYCRSAWDSLTDSASSAGRAVAGQSDAAPGSDDSAVRATWDAQVAQFAIASVLIDTSNLQNPYKTEEVDRRAVDYLQSKILAAPAPISGKWNCQAFYDEIDAAKKDLSGLTIDEILRKDYKQWSPRGKQLGISSVVQSLSWQAEKAGGDKEFVHAMKKFAVERKLDFFSILAKSMSNDGEHRREILFWSLEKSNDEYVEKFEERASREFGLEGWSERGDFDALDKDSGNLKVWWQKEIQNSRKQIAPVMREVIEGQ